MLKILVPTDFSDFSKYAFDFALSLAKKESAEIHTLHVMSYPIPGGILDISEIELYQTQLDRIVQLQMEKNMEAFIKDHDEVTSSVEVGIITKIIENYIEKQNFNLVIVGSHGLSGFKKFFIGSTTEKIIRETSCPVFSINEKTTVSQVNDIVFATNFKEVPRDLVQHLQALQKMFKAKVHFLKVNTPNNFEPDNDVQVRINDFFQKHEFDNYSSTIFNDWYEEDGIAHFAKNIKADIIALGTHGHHGIRRIFAGSIAEKVANHSSRLVWTYRLHNKSKKLTGTGRSI
jgi:nucleotide-binding universal stress UspA family protein